MMQQVVAGMAVMQERLDGVADEVHEVRSRLEVLVDFYPTRPGSEVRFAEHAG
jgi:hypothetical protein